ncbi:hypothetical protein BJF81_13505 [Ornithinimicrobium sp. CNJ-824]|uniref:hypothetical protein n=1 Tax=Ornithinimicrobium sp. CNJ-824 TaxID=1904966 RepID=UPI0009623B7E|nr:hypothetical protein [Ornithinimicrobium sp. CNJ-824]OLT22140.1 hypothetical protein BJF81_13505 [Ornithinimicrobium sp. CNJ-824]
MIVAVSALLVLSACDTTSEPSAPPTSEDALTTATAEPPAPVEDAEVTTEPEPTSEEPTEEAAAMDQTEEGAQAFVEHYVEVLGRVHAEDGDIEELRSLGSSTCETCAAFVGAAEQRRFGHEYVRLRRAEPVLTGEQARVETTLEQVTDGAEVPAVFELIWEGGRWQVAEIQLSSR